MDQTFVIIFTAVSFIIYGYSSFVSRRMKSEFIRWEFGNHRKTVGSLQILGGLGLLLGLKYNMLLVVSSFCFIISSIERSASQLSWSPKVIFSLSVLPVRFIFWGTYEKKKKNWFLLKNKWDFLKKNKK